MGEFLLSILGYNKEGDLIYTRKVPYAQFNAGDRVAIFYPHAGRENSKPYYRIYSTAYNPKIIKLLLETQDPNIIDVNVLGMIQQTEAMRHETDKKAYERVNRGHSIDHIAKEWNWHKEAVRASLVRHKERMAEEAKRKTEEVLATWGDA